MMARPVSVIRQPEEEMNAAMEAFRREMEKRTSEIWGRLRDEIERAGYTTRQIAVILRLGPDIQKRLEGDFSGTFNDIKASLIVKAAILCGIEPGDILYGRGEYARIKEERKKRQPDADGRGKESDSRDMTRRTMKSLADASESLDGFLKSALVVQGIDSSRVMDRTAEIIADEADKLGFGV